MRNTSSKLKKDRIQHLIDLEIRLMKYNAKFNNKNVEYLINQVRDRQVRELDKIKK